MTPQKLYIGASGIYEASWIPSDKSYLSFLKEELAELLPRADD
jgi:hypothetical protein